MTNDQNIIFIISNYINLKKIGKNYTALCPFHNEKTPSFTINEEKQFFYCFGCCKGGTVKTFLNLCEIKNIYKKNYINNIKKFTKLNNNNTNTTEQNTILYKKIIESSISELKKNIKVLNYCLKRNVGLEIIEMFCLGYMPSKSNNPFFKTYKKYKIFRMFSNKIIFPLKNKEGFILGLGGRTIKKNIKQKYINSENTKLFEKKKIIFGLNEVIKYSDYFHENLIIVEGYFDVLSLFSNNITNVISTLGTTIAYEQLNIILNYTKEIFFCYDGDLMGYNASIKNIKKIFEICKLKKKKIKNIKLPKKTDPDSFIILNGAKEFKKLINTTPYILE